MKKPIQERDEEEKISIIIPLYNTPEGYFKACLESINKQTYKNFEVIIVNDSSTINYEKIFFWYNQFFEIHVYTTKMNSGPGFARRLGLEMSTGKYILFVDSDDELYKENSLELLMLQMLKNPNLDAVLGRVCEECMSLERLEHKKNFIWVFGKLFNKQFLIDNKITFNDTRENEDNGFTTLFKIISNNYKWIDDVVYLWKYQPDSITRKTENDYYFSSINGFVNNMIWVYEECKKRNLHHSLKFLNHFCSVWIRLYFCCIEALFDRDIQDINLFGTWCYKFYDRCYKFIEQEIDEERFNANYFKLAEESIETFTTRICNISYPDFYNIITSGEQLIED